MGIQSIVGVYLAAGKSIRMGSNKLDLPYGSTYLGSLAFQEALNSDLEWIIAVTRKGDPLHWLVPFSQIEGWSMVQCCDADKGLSASLKEGVIAATRLGAKAILVLLADQPLVTSGIINRLLRAFQEPFTAASNRGVPMPPIVISYQLFPALMESTGDRGARMFLQSELKKGSLLELPANVFIDVDTQEDYLNLLKTGRDESECHRKKCDS